MNIELDEKAVSTLIELTRFLEEKCPNIEDFSRVNMEWSFEKNGDKFNIVNPQLSFPPYTEG